MRSKVPDLIRAAREFFDDDRNVLRFETGCPEAEQMLRDIRDFPHHFVLGCIMDRQIRASRAWLIPYQVGLQIGGFNFSSYERLNLTSAKLIFERSRLHRFNNDMARNFVDAICRIKSHYNGYVGNIWADTPSSAAVIRRFLEFEGVGIKIATMATNILVREFKVPMRDKSAIDISPDVQVMKFFKEEGLLRKEAGISELIYLARELNPDYPGLLDAVAWWGGRALHKK